MDIKEIMQIIEAVRENHLTSFELKEGETSLSLKRETGSNTVYVAGAPYPQTGAEPVAYASAGATYAPGTLPGGYAWGGQSQMPEAEGTAPASGEEKTGASGSEKVMTSPLVGVFYNAPSPDAEPFIKVGDTVRKGQVIGIVEAMKLMNEIESEYEGVVTDILIGNEEVVEFGQPLIRVK